MSGMGQPVRGKGDINSETLEKKVKEQLTGFTTIP